MSIDTFHLACDRCGHPVAAINPSHHALATGYVHEAMLDHRSMCRQTCRACGERKRSSLAPTCGQPECARVLERRVVADRIDDLLVLLERTTDVDQIAAYFSVTAASLIRWLHRHDRADLASRLTVAYERRRGAA